MSFFDPHYAVLPVRNYARELLRPWKLTTLAVGMTWLLYGATHYRICDWDIGVSLVMGGLTYLLAPGAVLILLSALRYRKRWWWLHASLAAVISLLVADGSYAAYHMLAGNPMDRAANFRASLTLFLLAGMIWLYRGPVMRLITDAKSAIRCRGETRV